MACTFIADANFADLLSIPVLLSNHLLAHTR